jgi:Flp pilus assembly pilin Flp
MEYALLGALIAVVCVLTITAVGTETLALYQVVCNGVALAISGQPCP